MKMTEESGLKKAENLDLPRKNGSLNTFQNDETTQGFVMRLTGIHDDSLFTSSEEAISDISFDNGGDSLINLPEDRLKTVTEKMLKASRVNHVRGCCKMARAMATAFNLDSNLAYRAALLHDCTKVLNNQRQLIILEKYAILPTETDLETPQIWHSISGAAVAEHVFRENKTVVNAIRWHTTGREEMSAMEAVLYLADMLEETRTFPKVEMLRTAAQNDLLEGLRLSLKHTLDYLEQNGSAIHPDTLSAYQWAMDAAGFRSEDKL